MFHLFLNILNLSHNQIKYQTKIQHPHSDPSLLVQVQTFQRLHSQNPLMNLPEYLLHQLILYHLLQSIVKLLLPSQNHQRTQYLQRKNPNQEPQSIPPSLGLQSLGAFSWVIRPNIPILDLLLAPFGFLIDPFHTLNLSITIMANYLQTLGNI